MTYFHGESVETSPELLQIVVIGVAQIIMDICRFKG